MERKESLADVLIIGAGAAGLMTAIQARHLGLKVRVADGREKIGAKILMSGGTRCNVTNVKVTEQDFQSEQIRAVRNVLRAFPSARAADFFKSLGVELVQEEGGKYFPETHSGRTVLDALLRELDRLGIQVMSGKKIETLKREKNEFLAEGAGFSLRARSVVLCTGGLSYPSTGSDGSGYSLAQSLGHSLVSTSPSLTPLLTQDEDWKKLSGVTLPVQLRLSSHDHKKVEYTGSFLFTHTGFSGPVVLNISRHWIRLNDPEAVLTVNFLPALPEEKFREMLGESLSGNPKMLVKNFLAARLPEKLSIMILKKAEIPETRILNQLPKAERERLIQTVYRAPLKISGSAGYAKAEVTAGGVCLKEVDEKTMESRLCPGLFFAGEILDVDGRIGGFNFQWAWSSGTVAAQGIARKFSEKILKDESMDSQA